MYIASGFLWTLSGRWIQWQAWAPHDKPMFSDTPTDVNEESPMYLDAFVRLTKTNWPEDSGNKDLMLRSASKLLKGTDTL